MIINCLEKNEFKKYCNYFCFDEYAKNKTFLITGSKGIVGQGIIKWLLYENNTKNINSKIIASTRYPNEIPNYVDIKDNIEFCEYGKEKEHCENIKIDYIIHAAAPTSNIFFKEKPVETLDIIVNNTKKILELAKEKQANMIYISSEEAYGLPNTDNPIDEKYYGAIDSLNIRNCYPLGKKVAELMCCSYHQEYGVNVKIIRPTVILGLFQDYYSVKVEAEIIRCIIENRDFHMVSDGKTKKSIIYSLDAVSAILFVLFMGNPGETYNATNRQTFCSVKERIEKIFKKYNDKLKIIYDNSSNDN